MYINIFLLLYIYFLLKANLITLILSYTYSIFTLTPSMYTTQNPRAIGPRMRGTTYPLYTVSIDTPGAAFSGGIASPAGANPLSHNKIWRHPF